MLVLFGWRWEYGLSAECGCYIITAPILLPSIAVNKPNVASLRVALTLDLLLADTRCMWWYCFFGGNDGALWLFADAELRIAMIPTHTWVFDTSDGDLRLRWHGKDRSVKLLSFDLVIFVTAPLPSRGTHCLSWKEPLWLSQVLRS